MEASQDNVLERTASGPWTDLALTLPIFLGYHLGVITLPVRNAADWGTAQLIELAENDLTAYFLGTIAVTVVFVTALGLLGRGKPLNRWRFVGLGVEGIIYALVMRQVAVQLTQHLFLSPELGSIDLDEHRVGIVMSFGAGFYEELGFRVIFFGLGLKLLRRMFPPRRVSDGLWLTVFWALVSSIGFSLWHHMGALGEAFDARIFLFRAICGLCFSVIYRFRGFAPAVWTHTLYDLWAFLG